MQFWENHVNIDIFSIDFFFYGQLLYLFNNSTPTLTLQICQCLTQFSLDIFLFYVKICLFLHHFGPKIRNFLQFYQKIFIKYLIFVKKSIRFLHVFDYFLTDREEIFFPAKESGIFSNKNTQFYCEKKMGKVLTKNFSFVRLTEITIHWYAKAVR